jgi:hypothetical protein
VVLRDYCGLLLAEGRPEDERRAEQRCPPLPAAQSAVRVDGSRHPETGPVWCLGLTETERSYWSRHTETRHRSHHQPGGGSNRGENPSSKPLSRLVRARFYSQVALGRSQHSPNRSRRAASPKFVARNWMLVEAYEARPRRPAAAPTSDRSIAN